MENIGCQTECLMNLRQRTVIHYTISDVYVGIKTKGAY